MKIQTFIFVHDQKIIVDFKESGKFSNLENLKYVFLGPRPIDQIEDMENVIIARNLEHNIEEHNSRLISYTGWWAVWKNKLLDADFVNLFEYDINLHPNFPNILDQNLSIDTDIIGYIPHNVHYESYIKSHQWAGLLVDSIKRNYNIDVHQMIGSFSPSTICSMTSNHTLSNKTFNEYMEWMEPIVDDIKLDKMAGHMTERSISLYYFIKKLPGLKLIPDVLHHFQLDTHKTQGIPESKFIDNYEKLVTNK